MSDVFARILGFQHDFARRGATTTVPVPGGFAVLHERYPASHDNNKLVVRSGDDAAELMRAAEDVLGGAGLRHRLVYVDDDELGREFAPAFAAGGYEHSTNVTMLFRGEFPELEPYAARLDPAVLVPKLRAEWRAELPGISDEAVDQLAERIEIRLLGADQVEFQGIVTAEGDIAARADLYAQDGIAQIESVFTDPAHRGRGHARDLLTSILAQVRGHEVVFLVADADDWPKDFYARLGFEPLARTHSFLRA